MDLEVVVEGVSDVRVANEIKRKIQQVCKETRRSTIPRLLVSQFTLNEPLLLMVAEHNLDLVGAAVVDQRDG